MIAYISSWTAVVHLDAIFAGKNRIPAPMHYFLTIKTLRQPVQMEYLAVLFVPVIKVYQLQYFQIFYFQSARRLD